MKKGAFTGAADTRKGKFEITNGGSIFFDEIGDMPPGSPGKASQGSRRPYNNPPRRQ